MCIPNESYLEYLQKRLHYQDFPVTSIDVGGNHIGDNMWINLSVKITHSEVKRLDLNNNNLTKKSVPSLSNFLRGNMILQSLDLCGNNFGNTGVKILVECLATNKTLMYLSIARNCIHEEGFIHIADCIRKNSSLRELVLSDNFLGVKGVKALAKSLHANHTLTFLSLDNNTLDDEGLKVFAPTISINNTLQELWLRGNVFGYKGEIALLESVRHNSSLVNILIDSNNETVIQEEIKQVLFWNTYNQRMVGKRIGFFPWNYRDHMVNLLLILTQLPLCIDLHWKVVSMLRVKDLIEKT